MPNEAGANQRRSAYGSGSPEVVEPAVDDATDEAGAVAAADARGSYFSGGTRVSTCARAVLVLT